ncbi:MAG: DNA repair exonuclease [Deltaproteobacteria bacterium HGW-Deltaproteobacteria-15]|jgi:DNA repair exonuclease SbcCD nuclease subunit|nr:MAG: DNA repair exonuclease [Deltaproteobacteria bacterium HGW-Deltaproteobacteria-15]
MFRFIHAADLHLDSPLMGLEGYQDAPVEQIRNAARRAFDNLVEIAIEKEAAFVLLAGDVFDGDWKDHNSGIYFMNRLGRLNKAGIRVFIASGNHDAASSISRALLLPENAILFPSKKPETRILEDIGVAIHGQSFPSRAVTEDLSRNYPPASKGFFNIGLLHTSLTGRPGHEPYAPCTTDGLCSKDYQYWALGHVHQREEVSREPWIVFPGNIQGRHIRETGPKGCTLVTVEGGNIIEMEAQDLDVFRWCVSSVDVSDCESINAVADLVQQSFQDVIGKSENRPVAVRLILEGETPVHRQLHERSEYCTDQFRGIAAGLTEVWLEKVIFKTRKEGMPFQEIDDNSPLATIEGEVAALKQRGASLVDFIPDIEQLRNKLPPELSGESELFPSGNEGVASLCEDVKDLLIGRILKEGGRYED